MCQYGGLSKTSIMFGTHYNKSPLFLHQKWWSFYSMEKQKTQQCEYKNNQCRRGPINQQVLTHMCEGDMFFKCYEFERLRYETGVAKREKVSGVEGVYDWA